MNKPIRILQVFGKMDRGGAETLIMNVYRNIDREKIQFDFLVHTQDKCAFDDEILSLGGRIYRVPRYKIYNHFQYLKNFKTIINEQNENWIIIHCHNFIIAPVIYEEVLKSKKKFIVHSHLNDLEMSFKGIIQHFFINKIKYFKKSINFSCSNDAGLWLFKKKNFIIFKNAIDVEKFKYNNDLKRIYLNELKINNKIIIGHIGRMDSVQKNHLFIIDIFFEFQKMNSDSALLLIGDGQLKQRIEKKVKKYNLEEKVIFLGVRDDVNKILNIFDIFVFPSLFEGLGIVLIEAQANGLRCIASDRVPKEAKITDLVDFLPLERGAKYWAEHIAKSLEYERKDRSEEIRKAGYDIKENTKWLENFYLELINKK